MENARLIALSIFVSYFLAIICLFGVILNSFRGLVGAASKSKVLAFSGLTVASFAHTWFYMFEFMHWSFSDYETTASSIAEAPLDRLTDWLLNTALFEQAWAVVSFGKMNWWWSEQLCLFTVGFWTAFLYFQGSRYGVKHVWAYMLLGQLVAISVASSLFYLAIILSPRQRGYKPLEPSLAPPVLWVSTFIALACVFRSPYTDESAFLLNLLVMHGLIVVPLFFVNSAKMAFWIPVESLYGMYLLAAVTMRIKTTAAAWESSGSGAKFLMDAWSTLHSHPAQSSIGYDVVWTTMSFMAWSILEGGGVMASLLAPVTSVGISAPLSVWPAKVDKRKIDKS
ncbi:hypothetical protein BDZ89DRAFT_1095413 [Hymenopellis radicata]|nr:hypothetical protein BDZ89DRAFT_1095413 [Hymenopellis radicata]